jgi:hypothetical protein
MSAGHKRSVVNSLNSPDPGGQASLHTTHTLWLPANTIKEKTRKPHTTDSALTWYREKSESAQVRSFHGCQNNDLLRGLESCSLLNIILLFFSPFGVNFFYLLLAFLQFFDQTSQLK